MEGDTRILGDLKVLAGSSAAEFNDSIKKLIDQYPDVD